MAARHEEQNLACPHLIFVVVHKLCFQTKRLRASFRLPEDFRAF